MKKTALLLAAFLAVCACNLGTVSPSPEGTAELSPTVTPEPSAAWTSTATIPAGFFPIAVGSAYLPGAVILLGGTENGAWLDQKSAASRMSGGETYTLYGPAGPAGSAVGSVPEPNDICPEYYFDWTPAPPERSLVGLAGGWNALPRIPEEGAASEYASVVSDWLAAQGVSMSAADLTAFTAAARVDLDGDGSVETIISAGRLSDENWHDVAAGDFTAVLLHREDSGQTIQLAGAVYPDARSMVFPSTYTLLSLLDLNGDGRMEVLVHIRLFEGEGTQAFSFDGVKAEQVLYTKCSA